MRWSQSRALRRSKYHGWRFKTVGSDRSSGNIIDDRVSWSSSDPCVEINQDGVITEYRRVMLESLRTSVLDKSKQAEIKVTVTRAQIEESARVASYSFDEENAQDEWGTRDGIDTDVLMKKENLEKLLMSMSHLQSYLPLIAAWEKMTHGRSRYWVKSIPASDRTNFGIDGCTKGLFI